MLNNYNNKKISNLKLLLSNNLFPFKKSSVYLGFKKGFNAPILPNKFYILYNHIWVRILRFIGGFCLLITLSGFISNFPNEIHFYIKMCGFIQSIQIIFVLIFKFCYGIYFLKFKSKELEVRNSPLNK